MSDEIKGLEALSESELRDRHNTNAARIAEIDASDSLSVDLARERRSLIAESNQIAELVTEFSAGDALTDLPAEADANADAVVDAAEEIVEEAASSISIESFTDDQVAELAEAVAAAAALQTAVNERPSEDAVTAAADEPTPQALTASAASTRGGVDAGGEVDLSTIGNLVQSLAYDRGTTGLRVPLVNLTPTVPGAASVSSQNSRSENTRAFAQAIAAAPFDICGPADILRDVPDCNNPDRYVPSWFRTIQSTHGQVEFYRSFGLADVIGGVNTWEQTDQAAVDPDDSDTWKECEEIGCLPTDTIGVEAVTQCITMPVFQVMTSPEAVASAISAVRAATARVADGQLLDRFDEVTSAYTFNASATGYGARVQVYDLLGRLLGLAAAANREVNLADYTLAVEVGFIETLFLDEQMRCNTEAALSAAADLFRGLGIGNIVFTPDWSTTEAAGPWSPGLPLNAPGAAAAAVPARPTSFKVRVFNPSDFAMLSPGGDSFGIIPDFGLKRQNKVAWFGELFEGLGKLGCRPAFNVEISNLTANGNRGACDVT